MQVKGRRLLMMSSNEYLGLSQHPRVIRAAAAAAGEWGTSPGRLPARQRQPGRFTRRWRSSSPISWESRRATSSPPATSPAWAGPSTLVRRGDALLLDRSIHSALWDGALLSGAGLERFQHEDMEDLERLLLALPPDQPKAIAVDGVYSMEGHIASLPRIAELAERHRAIVLVDDAHGLGVLGREGRGTADHHGVTGKIDLISGSFSKSLASTGGFLAGSRAIIEYLRSNCRQIIFSAALPASQAAAASEALRVMVEEPEHRERLWANADHYRAGLQALGVDYWNSPTPGLPVVLGDKEKCYRVWQALWEQGYFTVMAIAPGVAPGRDLIRDVGHRAAYPRRDRRIPRGVEGCAAAGRHSVRGGRRSNKSDMGHGPRYRGTRASWIAWMRTFPCPIFGPRDRRRAGAGYL